ncbi:hypothetical protein Cantr_08268 [Candida viswanathii]|uniref:ATPase inhibitor, mitochondrial n=1 Tax=Candida viswanathii TaxID=5486 RepID=A0A367XRG3_9ASCO|nr:hypothetical protein Cantr_05378 [Candida viswanathii]RCK60452.1 hypothetical protein Cantr_08268 [Candida viswanathii]
MLSQITRSSIRGARNARLFSTSRIAMTEGAIPQSKDAFAEKERAQENVYIKKQEAAQLKKLKEKLQQQQETIDKLEKELDDHKNGKTAQ